MVLDDDAGARGESSINSAGENKHRQYEITIKGKRNKKSLVRGGENG